MWILPSLSLLILSYLALLTHALPLNSPNDDRQQADDAVPYTVVLLDSSSFDRQQADDGVPYSVVLVDGGPIPPSTELVPTTIIKTVTAEETTTDTIIVVSTAVISDYPTPTTVLVTVTQAPTTPSSSASPSYEVVNPSPTAAGPVFSSIFLTPSPTAAAAAATPTAATISTLYANETPYTTALTYYPTTTTPSVVDVSPTSLLILNTPSTSSTKTYDNGFWHTTYPPWNATLSTMTTSTIYATGRAG